MIVKKDTILTYHIRYGQLTEIVAKDTESFATVIKGYEVDSVSLRKMLESLSSVYARDTNRSHIYLLLHMLAMGLDVSYDDMISIANDSYLDLLSEDEILVRSRADKDYLLHNNVYKIVSITDNPGHLTYDIDGVPTVLQVGEHYVLSSYKEVIEEELQKVGSLIELHPTYTPITHVNRVARVDNKGTILEQYQIKSFTDTIVQISSSRKLATAYVEREAVSFQLYTKVTTANYPIVGVPLIYNEEELDSEGNISISSQVYRITEVHGNEIQLSFEGRVWESGEKVRDLRDLAEQNIPLYIDYYYITDRILIDYEWGRDAINWTPSGTQVVTEGDIYYVTYRYGVRSFKMFENFARLLSFDRVGREISRTITRDEYRRATIGATTAFLTGPTIGSIKSLVKAFTHVEPEVRENTFDHHYISKDYLALKPVQSTGFIKYTTGKFDQGIVVRYSLLQREYFRLQDGRSTNTPAIIYFPAVSNISTKAGTIQWWVYPLFYAQDGVIYQFFQCINGETGGGFEIYKEDLGVSGSRFSNLVLDVYDSKGSLIVHLVEDISDWHSLEPHLITVTWNTYEHATDFVELYIDGTLVDSITGIGLDIGMLPEFAYLGNSSDGIYPCNSIIDEFRIQTKARTLEEIQRDYRKTTPFFLEPQAVREDYENTVTTLLLHFDGTLDRSVFKYKEEVVAHDYVDGRFGDAILLSKRSLNIEHDANTSLRVGLGNYSVDFWLLPYWNASEESNELYLFDATLLDSEQSPMDPSRKRVSLIKDGTILVFRIINSLGVSFELTYTIDWKLREWQHLAIEWSGNMMYLYENGRLMGEREYNEASWFTLTDFRFGQSYEGGLVAQIAIDDLRFSSVLRESDELSELLISSTATLVDVDTIRLYPFGFSTAYAILIEPYSDVNSPLKFATCRNSDYKTKQIEVDVLNPYNLSLNETLVRSLLEMLTPAGSLITVKFF